MSVFSDDKTRLPKPDYKYITNEEDARAALNILDQYPILSIDTECTDLDPYKAKISLIQIGAGKNAFVFDVRHDTEHSSLHKDILKSILFDNNKLKIFQNVVFDMKLLKVHMGEYISNIYDTMLVEQLFNLGRSFRGASLKDLVLKYLGIHMDKEPQGTFKDYNQKFKNYQIEYSANDVIVLPDIMNAQLPDIKKHGFEGVCQLEFDFTKAMCEMELNGITVDTNKWRIIMSDIEKEKNSTGIAISEVLDRNEDQTTLFGISLINIDSNAQLKKALIKYGLNIESTDVNELAKHAGIPVIDMILEYRKDQKLISTYGETLLEKIHPMTGRLHTSFKQMVSTGRMSSSNPNLQNIPKKQKYRSCFVAKEGYVLITSDMASAELKILGNVSVDPIFLECFKNNIDLHTRSASEVFRVSMDKVDTAMRNACKALSFGLMYGLSKYGLAKRLRIPEKKAEKLINDYFTVYSRVKQYLDKSAKDAVKLGYSLSISGRKRFYSVPEWTNPDRKGMVAGIKRQAMNAPIQGSLVFDSKIKGLGSIGNYVNKRVTLETGLGKDTATGVYSGKKKVHTLKLSNGSSLDITLEHKIPVITENGPEEKEVRNIDLGKDYLMIPLHVEDGVPTDLSGYKYEKSHWRETYKEYTTPTVMTKDLAFIIGCLIGDGNYSSSSVRFFCPDYQIELFNKFNDYFLNVFNCNLSINEQPKKNCMLKIVQSSSVVIRGFLKNIGLDYVVGKDKSIPEYFHTETLENKGALLNGLFSTDGGMTKKSGPNYTTVSKNLANDIHQLLFSLGIPSNLKTYKEEKGLVYRIQIPKRSNSKFKKSIGFSVIEKNNLLDDEGSVCKCGDGSVVPSFISKLIAKELYSTGVYKTLTINDKAHVRRLKQGCSSFTSWRKFYFKMLDNSNKKLLSKYLNFDFCTAKELEYKGEEDTYDLMCDNIYYFTVNGVVVHNSNADTIKKAMILLVDRLESSGYDAKLLLSVHDEVIVESRNDQRFEVAKIVAQSLIDGFGEYFHLIPMEADSLIGPCWLKSSCENKINGKKCGGTEMISIADKKYGTKIICKKCGGDI